MTNLLRIRNLTRNPLRVGTTNIPVTGVTGAAKAAVVDLNSSTVRRDLVRTFPRWTFLAPFGSSEGLVLNGAPTGVLRESVNRLNLTSDLAALTTQVMNSVAVPVAAGDVITNVSFLSGATAAGTPTNWWFAIYDSSGNLLSQTADQLTAAWAADTLKTVALAAPQTITDDGFVYAAIMVKATTPPTLAGRALARAAVSTGPLAGQIRIAATSGSALVGVAPATIATPTAVVNVPYAILT